MSNVSAGNNLGDDHVMSAYSKESQESWRRVFDHVREQYPVSSDEALDGLIGRKLQTDGQFPFFGCGLVSTAAFCF